MNYVLLYIYIFPVEPPQAQEVVSETFRVSVAVDIT